MRKLNNFTKNWNAQQYLQQYYSSNKINSDETITLKYLVEFLRTANKTYARSIDVGSGPTLHQIIPLIPFVEELHLTDFVPGNLAEIKKWLDGDSTAHNWDIYIQYVLGLEKTRESLQQRKQKMRERITKLLPIDIYQPSPLGRPTTYPLVTSFFCADSVAKSKQEWEQCMINIFSLVEPGGTIVVAALRNADSYQVVDRQFPSPHVNEKDFKQLFKKTGGFVDSSINIQIVRVPEWVDEGFDSAILVKAEKVI